MYQIKQDGQDVESNLSLVGAAGRAKERARQAGKGKVTVMRQTFDAANRFNGDELVASYSWVGGKLIPWVR